MMDQQWLSQVETRLASGDALGEVDLLHAVHDTFLEDEIRRGSLADLQVLDGFMHYALKRRFGWSEAVPCSARADQPRADSLVDEEEPVRSSRPSLSGLSRPLEQGRENLKHAINQSLDAYLTALRNSRAVRGQLLAVLISLTGSNEVVLPFVRGQVYKFFYDWLKAQAIDTDDQLEDHAWLASCFEDVQRVIVCGLTDVWSAIRKSCAVRLSAVADVFVIGQMERLTRQLLAICASESSAWQQVEGSLLGLSAIVKKFRVELCSPPDGSASDPGLREDLPVFTINFGQRTYPKLPSFVSDELHPVLFSRLAHSQLSVRESANKVFAPMLARSDVSTAVATLDEAVARLKRRDSVGGGGLAGADEAAGLMTLCITILKLLPGEVGAQRPEMTDTFRQYLDHPASTVRQVTSTLFECLATRELSSSSDILTKVLAGLTTPSASQGPIKWQGREGRLLAVELIVRRLVRGHLARLLNLELRLELKSPEPGSDGVTDASPLPLWPKAVGRTKGGPKTAAEDMSLIDRLRWCQGEPGAMLPGLWTRLILDTVDCMMSSQWELRRMAAQVLPLLTQVVFWFDMSILELLWTNSFGPSSPTRAQPAEQTLAGCVTLKYSMALAARLTQLLGTASAARLLVTERAEQVQALLARFSQVVIPLAPRVFHVLRQVAPCSSAMNNSLLEACVEVLLYMHSFWGTSQQEELAAQLSHVVGCLEQIQSSAARHGDKDVASAGNPSDSAKPPVISIPAKQASLLQASIVSSMYAVLPELALKVAPEYLLQYGRLQLWWALQYDHMEERKCILEAMRRVLLRIVRLRNIATEWPWDTLAGESLAQRSVCLSPGAQQPPEGNASPGMSSPDRMCSLQIDVKPAGTNIRQLILRQGYSALTCLSASLHGS